ncbi:MAG TPA: methionyl-tRNA formyltransferase, partial [Phycisphaerales bacterium]|nr:methionyl-tRNA formyltransferase [Phycisphaerales bacterium]
MKLLFLGSGEFGLPTLKALAAHHEVLAVVSQPDRPAGRHRRLTPTPIAAWAAEHRSNTPLFKPEDINTPDVISRLHALEADAWVVIAFGQKLSRTLVDDRFVINLHASLLPRWRGAAPINHAMLAGDAETGNSVITIAERMDAGFVLGQSKKPITVELTAGELHDLLASDGPALIEQVLAAHANHSLRPVTQDE